MTGCRLRILVVAHDGTDCTRRARASGQICDLPVRGDRTFRDACDDGMHRFLEVGFKVILHGWQYTKYWYDERMYDGVGTSHKMQYVRYGIVAVLALCLIGVAFWYAHSRVSYSTLSVFPTAHTDATSPISFEIVTGATEQERGLGGRKNIAPDYGMLFVFPKDDSYGIWMKDMLVPIDIIWLSDTGVIVHLEPSVEPSTYPHVFYPDSPARYVLEMRAGEANARGWKRGTHVRLPLPYGK